jgi:alkanesulfonate monooxygenase SsuD/methylene tetrahydromethanopterin reductase-like flavin-dependent oxidoreductase (luciferase family)
MKFGLFGGATARRGGVASDSNQGYRDFIDYVVEAEELGFHSVFLVEHHFTGYGQVSASLNLLTFLAARTSRIRLGTAVVVVPWHNPILLAEKAATVDLLSNGRLDFGVGKGYRHNEFHGFDIPMAESTARFEEGIEVIRKAWTSDERFTHRGRFWLFEDVIVEPPTVQKPHPPFWLASGRPESIRYAAAHGYNLLLDQVAGIDQVIERFGIYRDAVEAAGRRFDPASVAVARALHVAQDADDLAHARARRAGVIDRINALARTPDGVITSTMFVNNDTRLASEEGSLIGTPDTIAGRIERLRAGGIEYLLLVDVEGRKQDLRTFARAIMPAFDGASAAAAAQ